jgi:hypothetical protein
MTPCWKLEIFDADGNIITVVEKSSTSPFHIHGSLESVPPILPSIIGLTRFFHKPSGPMFPPAFYTLNGDASAAATTDPTQN